MSITIQTAGRRELDDLFRKSDAISVRKLNQTPFLVFEQATSTVMVQIENNAETLCERYADQTPVMFQWRGRWDSDWFQMTVGDIRRALATRDAAKACKRCHGVNFDPNIKGDVCGTCADDLRELAEARP